MSETMDCRHEWERIVWQAGDGVGCDVVCKICGEEAPESPAVPTPEASAAREEPTKPIYDHLINEAALSEWHRMQPNTPAAPIGSDAPSDSERLTADEMDTLDSIIDDAMVGLNVDRFNGRISVAAHAAETAELNALRNKLRCLAATRPPHPEQGV